MDVCPRFTELRIQREAKRRTSRRSQALSFCLVVVSLLVVINQIVSTPAYGKIAERSDLCDVVTLQFDNDEMGGTDRHYTGANRLACLTSPPHLLRDLLSTVGGANALTRTRATYTLGQSAFTPDNISRSELIEDDQPYAGWLYLGLGLEREVIPKSDGPRYLENLELQLGIIGPWSGVEHVQKQSHDLTNATAPQGWGNQLDNEPGINLFYSRQWTGASEINFKPGSARPNLFADVTPEVGFALGNIYIFGAAGLTFRLGGFEPDDHGPPTVRPSLPGSDYFPRQEGFSAYVFGGVEGRVVGRNIFLDGNTFQDDGPSVDKNILVGEARIGLALTYERVRLAYTHVFRSQEFENQSHQTYGSIALSVAF